MKKILSLFMLVMCIAVGANAQSGTTENGLSWEVENRVLTITGNGAINDGEAHWGTNFSTVVIGEGVTSIGANAFKNCFDIKSVFYSGNSSIFDDWTINDVFNGVAIEDIAFYRSPSSSVLSSIFTGYFKADASNEILWTLLNGVFTARSDKAITEDGDLEGIADNSRIMISISTISVENATALVSENGALLSSDRSKLLLACNKSGSTVVVPETVERIGAYAFYASTSISGVKSLSATAPALSNNSFNVNRKIAKLALPNNTPATVDAYSAWSGYFTVVQTGDIPSSGSIDNVSWSISNKVLTISGSGTLTYSAALRESCSYFGVNEVRVESGVTEIANNAFYQNTASKYTFYYNAKISDDSGISEDATLNLVLADGKELVANANSFNKITLNRTFAAGATGTVILPFDATVPNAMKVYSFKSYNNKVIQFAETHQLNANTPYIWKTDATVSSISSNGEKTALSFNQDGVYASTEVDGWTMYGVYSNKTVAPTTSTGPGSNLWIYKNQKGGQFVNYDKINVTPYRAYIYGPPYDEIFPGSSANGINASFPERSLSIEFIDKDGTTTIEDVLVDRDGNLNFTSQDGVYYDLSGRRVENPTSGIYIVNGKKVLVK